MPYDPAEEVDWKLLAKSDELVTRNGVDLPAWFDMELSKPEWPMKIVLSVTVDQHEGPLINGIRGPRDQRVSYQGLIKFFRENTDPPTFLRFVTTYAGTSLLAARVMMDNYDEIRASGKDLKEVATALQDHYARKAWPATKTQRRRRVTPALLAQVAEVYRKAYSAGEPPTQAVAGKFQVSHSTAGRWVVEARKIGALGPSVGPTGGEQTALNASE